MELNDRESEPQNATSVPLVSIVTPTFNTGTYIEETILSVLAQDYPNVEYIVMDAGSTDGTVDILKKYEGRLQYTSQPDAGTADAINKGFARSHGSILAFLNADDTYMPGAISTAVCALMADPVVAMVYGEGDWVNERGKIIGRYPTAPFNRKRLESDCFICQPASFFRRMAFEAVGGMDPKLHYAFDYDLWIRMARRFELRKLDDLLATSRLHQSNKTVGQRRLAVEEALRLLRNHFNYLPLSWICSDVSLRVGEKIEIPLPTKLSLRTYCLALPAGLMMNRRHPARYLREWMGVLIHNRFWRYAGGRVLSALAKSKTGAYLSKHLGSKVSGVMPRAARARHRFNRLRAPKLGVLYQHAPRTLSLVRRPSSDPARTLPKISIVTPSFNQGTFIERTLRSVMDLQYPSLEYVVQDGGSTDETRSILERYSSQLHYWESAADAGQAQAINRGFAHTSGEIMAWLNSDDILLPGSLQFVGSFFSKHPEVDAIYGHRLLIDSNDAEVGRWVLPPHQNNVLVWADYVPQESLFWRRRVWDRVGAALDESFDFAMDWDLLLRFRRTGVRFVRVPRFLAAFRVHPQQKTSAQFLNVGRKEMDLLRAREHGRSVSEDEIDRHVGPYLRRHLFYHALYRLRSTFGSQD